MCAREDGGVTGRPPGPDTRPSQKQNRVRFSRSELDPLRWKIQYCQMKSALDGVKVVTIAPVELLPKYRFVPTERKRAAVALAFTRTQRWVGLAELHGDVKTLPAALLSRQRPLTAFLIRKAEPDGI